MDNRLLKRHWKLRPFYHTYIRFELDRITKDKSLDPLLIKHAQIAQYAREGLPNTEIQSLVHMDQKNIATWRRRFMEQLETLNNLAQEEEYQKCYNLLIETLTDHRRKKRRNS